MPLQAEDRRLDKPENEEYLPIDGLPAFKQATVELLLGAGSPVLKEVSCSHCQFPHCPVNSHCPNHKRISIIN